MKNQFYKDIGAQNQLPISFCSDLMHNKTLKARNSTPTHYRALNPNEKWYENSRYNIYSIFIDLSISLYAIITINRWKLDLLEIWNFEIGPFENWTLVATSTKAVL